ncbi:MAG: hypothetical protein Q7T42_06775 [Methylotenera sp.]|uniref:hypothetical protein n=1 Tax=Methylotenera sp. TaxID=2051956 RepID=UPI0027199120|nr:hypothetical protein [Methylotenera sp.]MDO9393656.1 hypothetical protein [Methylotenera sp.]MDP1521912.1 hypothetical protein [Methylotenera sp.]MDZ4211966.1 hypothetical protein [Methylotenera sp.]
MEQVKQFFKTAATLSVGFAVLFAYLWLGREIGASQWLTGVVGVFTVVVLTAGLNYRNLDEKHRKALSLLFISLLVLTVVSLVNEYVEHFFSPGRLHFILAFLPSILFLTYRTLLEQKTSNTPNDHHDGGDN